MQILGVLTVLPFSVLSGTRVSWLDMDPLFKASVAISKAASKKSCILNKANVDAIVNHLLRQADKVDHHCKHWVKTRMFQVVDLPGIGLSQVLVMTKASRFGVVAVWNVETAQQK